MSSRIAAIAIDAEQPGRIATFWGDVLGWDITQEHDSIVSIAAPDGTGPTIDVLAVPESKSVKNRIHLDLSADSPNTAGELKRLLAMGARPINVGQDADVSWVVLSDPEGNEFCLLAGE